MRPKPHLLFYVFVAVACLVAPLLAQAGDAQDALKAALRAGDEAAVRAAIEDGADPNDGAVPPLIIAAMRGDLPIIHALLDAGADPDAVDPRGRSALVAAIVKQHHDVMITLIAAGADVNLPESSPGRSPLQLVIDEAPSIRSMEILLDAGADIDQADERGETALASAAFMGRMDAARMLIDRGARLDVVNLQDVSPLEWARRQGNTQIVQMLRDAGMTE